LLKISILGEKNPPSLAVREEIPQLFCEILTYGKNVRAIFRKVVFILFTKHFCDEKRNFGKISLNITNWGGNPPTFLLRAERCLG